MCRFLLLEAATKLETKVRGMQVEVGIRKTNPQIHILHLMLSSLSLLTFFNTVILNKIDIEVFIKYLNYWCDAGTHMSLPEANEVIMDQMICCFALHGLSAQDEHLSVSTLLTCKQPPSLCHCLPSKSK